MFQYFFFQLDNNIISSNKPGKYRERSYDNLKTGKLHLHRTSYDRSCVITRSPHLSKKHYQLNSDKLKQMQSNEINSIFSPVNEDDIHLYQQLNLISNQINQETDQFNENDDDDYKHFKFIDIKTTATPTAICDHSTSTSSSFSSLTPLSSPTHLPMSQIKLIPTLIPAQYRVYIPQKKFQMDEFYTDYVYSADQTVNQLNKHSKIYNDINHQFMDAKAT